MNVVNFPVCRFLRHALVGPQQVAEGLHWYGGRGFKTTQEVIDGNPVTQPSRKCLAFLQPAGGVVRVGKSDPRLSRFSFSLKEQ